MLPIKRIALLAALSTTLAACNSNSTLSSSAALPGSWHVSSIQNKAVIANSNAQLTFNTENKLSGSASCNIMFASYTLNADKIDIGPVATTQKMCLSASMDQEQLLLQALNKVKRFQLNNDELSMYDQQGVLQIQAKRTKL
ncbi:META domain-containing protein [Colwellia ponticola]|uniref:META domain-containing protein n=1 Tax=Colwellia ponticola TaxID=2304625 RepID=A0A8H2PKK9_9GAMM|nr:META domain-containing protein [Colwellia ponticola]TMM41483.1 META domain-containing protein [Colwellia ponticola]